MKAMRGSFRFVPIPVPRAFRGKVDGAGAPLYWENAPLSSGACTAMDVALLRCPAAASGSGPRIVPAG